MSFLEELENSKEPEENKLNPRKLWESCYKYFKHFTGILQSNKNTFAIDFNFTFLNMTQECVITEPFEISRTQVEDQLRLEVKMQTKLKHSIKIERKDLRSAELLKNKLYKDGILSTVKQDNKKNYLVELKDTIVSYFRIILVKNQDMHIEYHNIGSSNKRIVKLPLEKINEKYLDGLAKYILGKNPDLYKETISNREIQKIRQKLEQDKRLQAQKDAIIKMKKEAKGNAEQEKPIRQKSIRLSAEESEGLLSKFFDKFKKK